MHQPSTNDPILPLESRESILSHSAVPILPLLKSLESDPPVQIPSFQFIDTSPSAYTKSLRNSAFVDTTPSMNGINGDLDLRYQKSTASSNGLLLKEQEGNHSMEKNAMSLNMIGEAVSLNDLEMQKSSERNSIRRISFRSGNVHYPETKSDEEVGEAICLSAGNRRLLCNSTSTPPKLTKGGFKGYRFFKDEKENQDSLRGESARFRDNRGDLLTIQEDENSPNFRRQTNNETPTPARKKSLRANREFTPNRSVNNSNMNAVLTIFSESIRSPTSVLSPIGSNRMLVEESPNLDASRPNVSAWEPVVVTEDGLYTIETKLDLKRKLSIFVALGIFSVVLYFAVNDSISFENLYIVGFLYLVYYGVENVVRACSPQRESWRQTEDIYSTIDALSAVIFLLLIKLKAMKVISVSMISFIPFLATAWAHHVLSEAPVLAKRSALFLRCFYTTQVFLISGKLDRVLDWDWRIILGLSWICFGFLGLHSLFSTIKEISKLLKDILTHRLRQNVSLPIEFIGLIWSLFYYSLYIVAFLGMMGCPQAFLVSEKRQDILELSAFVSFCLNVFLTMYTLLAFQLLTQFLKKYQRVPEPVVHLESPQVNLKKQVTINLEVVNNKSYFVMLSSTYFLPLKNGFVAKKDENIKKIKKMISNFKSWKSKKQLSAVARSPKPAKIQDLMQDKDALDEKFSKIANGNKKEGDFARAARTAKARAPTTLCFENVTGIFSREKENSSGMITTETHRKHPNLSADDLQFNKDGGTLKSERNLSSKTQQNEENLCYLCYENSPNAVLMGCGHGGICYECASALVIKKNECMECRSSVDAIYKVDANLKVCDIVKGVEISKVCVSP